MTIRLSKDQRIRILNSRELARVMQGVLRRDALIDRRKEHFWVVGLADNDLLLYVELISLGGRRATVVEPMDIFRWALQKDSAKLVLVHNHPRGSLVPSVPDVELTAQLYQVGELLELPVVDHLIITETAYYSFVDGGIMAELVKTKKHLLSTAAQERLKAEAAEVAKAEGEKVGREAEKLSVASAMKAEGIEAAAIARITGLSVAKIKGIKVPKAKA